MPRDLFADEPKDLFADDESLQQQSNQSEGVPPGGYNDFSHLKPELKNLAGGILDMFSRAGTALGEAGQFAGNNPLTRAINRALPESVKFVPNGANRVNIRELTGADQGGQDILGDRNSTSYKLGQVLGGAGQAGLISGSTLPRLAIGSGISTGLTANPDEKLLSSNIPVLGDYVPSGRLPAAIESSLLTALSPYAAKATINGANKVASGISGATDLLRPGKLATSIMNELSGGKTLEEHGKDFASNIKQSFENEKQRISNRYNEFFNKNNLNKQELYPEQLKYTKEGKVKVGDEFTRNMPEFPSGLGSEEYENSLEKFKNNPTFKNGHELQSKLASEQRLLQRQYDTARATGQDATQLSRNLALTNKSRQQLLTKMHDSMDEIEPGLSDEYKSITADYLKNQVPYHGDRNLRDIIYGRNTNPTRSQFNSIFKNPDEGINTILNHMGDSAKNDVLFQSLGLQPEDLTARELVKNMKNIRKSGFESYESPELKNAVSKVSLARKIKGAIPYGVAGTIGATNPLLGYMIYKNLLRNF